jgi:DtxR family transcriptional regulator, Mn-dependent transcriptional regulator
MSPESTSQNDPTAHGPAGPVHPEFLAQPSDEILESVWCLRERDEATIPALLARLPDPETENFVQQMVQSGLLRLDGEQVLLGRVGELRARALVRGHRLAERLLHDVLSLPQDEAEETACLMEHVLSPLVTDAVCSFLGHPPTSPSGLPIPPGACCEAREREVQPLVVPLPDLELGKSARIVFLSQRFHKRIDRLGSYGVVPGSVVRLRQKRPSYVLALGSTSLALDPDVAREIYVRREE